MENFKKTNLDKVFLTGGLAISVVGFLCSLFFEYESSVILLAKLFLIATLMLACFVVCSPEKGGLSLLFVFFFVVLVAIPSLVQVSVGGFPYDSYYNSSELVVSYRLLMLSIIAFYVRDFFDFDRVLSVDSVLGVSSQRFYYSSVKVMLILCLIIIVYVGPQILLFNRAEFSLHFARNGGGVKEQLVFVGRSISLLAFIILVVLNKYDKSLVSPLVVGFSFVILIFLNYPPGLPRFQLFGIAIAVSAVYLNYFSAPIKAFAAIFGVVLLIVIFPVAKTLSGKAYTTFSGSIALNEPMEYLLKADFDAFKQVADTAIYVETEELRWGENFLGAALFFVPRGLWSGKPIDSGEIVSVSLGYRYNNVANPLTSEAYIAFGYIGVFGVFYLLSVLISSIEARTKQTIGSNQVFSEYFLHCVSMGFIIIVLRGSLNGVAPIFGSGFLAYYVLRGLDLHRKQMKHD